MMDVMVIGAAGKMGSLTCATVAAQEDMRLAAAVDPAFAGGAAATGRFADVAAALAGTRPEAAVDFTLPETVFETVSTTVRAGVHTVVGTTGLSDEQVGGLARLAGHHGANLMVIPNFSLGAVLMMSFAAQAARHLPRAEIIEIHEEGKADAPSGTALRTARLMEEAGAGEPRAADSRPSRGLRAGGVCVHSVRLPGAVAHQEVVFGGTGEMLRIRHDSLSRDSFMPGVLLALHRIRTTAGTVVGLESLLDDETEPDAPGGPAGQ
jgi:4-hydroxy-tetrahydrodipicolinate reductase